MKRRIFCIMIAAVLAAMLSACQSEQKAESLGLSTAGQSVTQENAGETKEGDDAQTGVVPVSVTVEHVENTVFEDSGYEVYKYPKFYLSEADKAGYPALSKALESYNSEQESKTDLVLEELKENYEEIDTGADTWYVMSVETTATAVRADSNVVSFLCEYYTYIGGAHDYCYAYGVNYDSKTGKELTLGDVVKDKDAFIELVSEAFDEKYSDISMYGELTNAGEALEECDFDSDEGILWTIDPVCVSLYFEPYNLGTYAQGEQVVSIYFDDAPEVFDEHYTTACDDYVLPITDRKPLGILSSSGEREEISAEMDYAVSNEFDIHKVAYTIGDTRLLSSEDFIYDVNAFLVHADGKNYIYAFQGTIGDSTYLSVVDADNKCFVSEAEMVVSLKRDYHSDDTQDGYVSVEGNTAFTDPSQFALVSRLELLGTYSAYRSYHVGTDGRPVSDDELYTAAVTTAFKTRVDFECDTVDKDGNATGKATIPADSYLVVVRTDGDSVADLQIVDSRFIDNSWSDPDNEEWSLNSLTENIEKVVDMDKPLYRVQVDTSEFSQMVNGESLNDIFVGISYSD